MNSEAATSPDVSVIIPTFNRAEFLAQAVDSCLASQEQVSVEVTVVDDHSTDSTAATLAPYGSRIRLVTLEENRGSARARNVGMEMASGCYLKFLDSDDVLVSGTLEQEKNLADKEQADIVLSGWGTELLDSEHKTVPGTRVTHEPPSMKPVIESLLEGKAVPTSGALYRTDFIRPHRWDPEIKHPEDWYFFCMAVLAGVEDEPVRERKTTPSQHLCKMRKCACTLDFGAHSPLSICLGARG